MFRFRLRTLLIVLTVAPPMLAVAVYFVSAEDGWRSLAGMGLVIAWLAVFCSTNVEAPKPP
jgi:hypothetical protein